MTVVPRIEAVTEVPDENWILSMCLFVTVAKLGNVGIGTKCF